MTNKAKLVVLLAEDSKHDILATERAWKMHNIANPLHVVRDGEECLDYLYRRGKYSDADSAPRPGLLLLDLKMPRMDGLTVLKHIREDESLKRLPVTVLTTSDQDEDRLRSYELKANAFIRKPVGFENFAAAVKAINMFWELVDPPYGEDGR
jgi:CheY-like chemotaxis protein